MKDHSTTLAALTEKHGQLAHLVLPDGGLIAFRRPTLEEWEDFLEARSKQRVGIAFRQLALTTRVYPESTEDLNLVLKDYPALLGLIVDAVGGLAGSGLDLTVKKG